MPRPSHDDPTWICLQPQRKQRAHPKRTRFGQKDKTSVVTQGQRSFAWLDLGKVARWEGPTSCGHGIHAQQVILGFRVAPPPPTHYGHL